MAHMGCPNVGGSRLVVFSNLDKSVDSHVEPSFSKLGLQGRQRLGLPIWCKMLFAMSV